MLWVRCKCTIGRSDERLCTGSQPNGFSCDPELAGDTLDRWDICAGKADELSVSKLQRMMCMMFTDRCVLSFFQEMAETMEWN